MRATRHVDRVCETHRKGALCVTAIMYDFPAEREEVLLESATNDDLRLECEVSRVFRQIVADRVSKGGETT